MQPAFIESVKKLLPDVPHQYCQYHFLKNVGEFIEDNYSELENKAKSDHRYKSLANQIKSCWCGLFLTYEDSRIPRINNDMGGLIKETRQK